MNIAVKQTYARPEKRRFKILRLCPIDSEIGRYANAKRHRERIEPITEAWKEFVMRHGFEPSLKEWGRKARADIRTIKKVIADIYFQLIRDRVVKALVKTGVSQLLHLGLRTLKKEPISRTEEPFLKRSPGISSSNWLTPIKISVSGDDFRQRRDDVIKVSRLEKIMPVAENEKNRYTSDIAKFGDYRDDALYQETRERFLARKKEKENGYGIFKGRGRESTLSNRRGTGGLESVNEGRGGAESFIGRVFAYGADRGRHEKADREKQRREYVEDARSAAEWDYDTL